MAMQVVHLPLESQSRQFSGQGFWRVVEASRPRMRSFWASIDDLLAVRAVLSLMFLIFLIFCLKFNFLKFFIF